MVVSKTTYPTVWWSIFSSFGAHPQFLNNSPYCSPYHHIVGWIMNSLQNIQYHLTLYIIYVAHIICPWIFHYIPTDPKYIPNSIQPLSGFFACRCLAYCISPDSSRKLVTGPPDAPWRHSAGDDIGGISERNLKILHYSKMTVRCERENYIDVYNGSIWIQLCINSLASV